MLRLLTGCVALALGGCEPPAVFTWVIPATDWIAIDAKQYSFYIPPDMKEDHNAVFQEGGALYRNDVISLSSDYGPWSDPLTHIEKPWITEQTERIDGRWAKIVNFHNPGSGHPFDYVMAVHFSDTGDPKSKLTLFATCKSPEEYETLRTIFRTVKFKSP